MHNAATMQPSADVAAINEIRVVLEACENAFDAEPMIDVMADDMVIMVPNFAVKEGKAAASDFVREITCWMKDAFERRVISYTSDEVSITGNIAFDRGRFSFTVSVKNREPELVTGKYLWLLRRDGERWKLTRMLVCVDEADEGSPEG